MLDKKKQLARKYIFIHLPQFITKNNGVICSTEVCEVWGGIIDRTRGASGAKRTHSKSRRNSRWSTNNVTSRDLIRPYPIQYNIQRERIRTYSQYGHVKYDSYKSTHDRTVVTGVKAKLSYIDRCDKISYQIYLLLIV